MQHQRQVNHLPGYASIDSSVEERLIGGKSGRVDPNANRQRENGSNRKSRVARQHARPIPQIQEDGLWQDHQIDLAHPLSPQAWIPETSPRVPTSFRLRHSLLNIQLLAHREVERKLFLLLAC